MTNIAWDDDADMPTTMIVEVEDDLEYHELMEAVSDAVTEATGYCHWGFNYQPMTS